MITQWVTPNVVNICKCILQSGLILVAVVVLGAYMSLIERRVLGLWQDRYGPNRVGPFGMFQLVADMLKIFFKEDWIPPFADRFLFVLAPIIAMSTALLSFIVIPITSTLSVGSLSVDVLFFMAMGGLSVYATLLAGYASANKYALLGMVRAVAQSISYEVFLGLSMMGVVARAGSFNLHNIVLSQQGLWNVLPQFLGFVTFLVASIALIHRHPFDQPEAEQELADGYHIEYGGMKWGMFFVGEYIGITMVSSMIVTLFFGGWLGPFNFIPPFVWFAGKTFCFMMFFILLRASLPRPRYDKVMSFGWTVCLPVTLLNLLITGVVLLWQGGSV